MNDWYARFMLTAIFVLLAFSIIFVYPCQPSKLVVYTDEQTGVQYVGVKTLHGVSLCPRYDANGAVMVDVS